MNQKREITKLVILGDSLSDAGAMNEKVIMRYLSGVSRTPEGRFTNGKVWSDHLLKKNSADSKRLELKHPTIKRIDGQRVLRSYAIGGATSHTTSADPQKVIVKKMLSNLKEERKKLLKDDKKYFIESQEKDKTLIAEWSGANDLATVSSQLLDGNINKAKEQAEYAVIARRENVAQLIEQGYKNFVLFSLPDMSKTPRFSKESISADRKSSVRGVCNYFNQRLETEISTLREEYPEVEIFLFDVNKAFNTIHEAPEKHGFSSDTKLMTTEPIPEDLPSPLFSDDVHPSSKAHEKIAEAFQTFCGEKFSMQLGDSSELKDKSAKEWVDMFVTIYEKKNLSSNESTNNQHRLLKQRALDIAKIREQAKENPELALKMIFEHAKKRGVSSQTYKILKRLDLLTASVSVLEAAREQAGIGSLATKEDLLASFSFNLDTCKLFLMSSHTLPIQKSDSENFYLYKDETGNFYYVMQSSDEMHYLYDDGVKNALKEAVFHESIENPSACANQKLRQFIIREACMEGDRANNSLAKGGHKVKKMGLSHTLSADNVLLKPDDDKKGGKEEMSFDADSNHPPPHPTLIRSLSADHTAYNSSETSAYEHKAQLLNELKDHEHSDSSPLAVTPREAVLAKVALAKRQLSSIKLSHKSLTHAADAGDLEANSKRNKQKEEKRKDESINKIGHFNTKNGTTNSSSSLTSTTTFFAQKKKKPVKHSDLQMPTTTPSSEDTQSTLECLPPPTNGKGG